MSVFSNHHRRLEPCWQPGRRYFSRFGNEFHGLNFDNRDLRHWLLDTGSLTMRLVEASDGSFNVQRLSQRLGYPRLSECRALGMPLRRLALIREVILWGCGQPWVFARSILPVTTLTGRLRFLGKLDNRPLGALLFRDPGMRRGHIEVARITAAHRLLPAVVQSENPVWGRRSVFFLAGRPLLVSEVFLDTFDRRYEVLGRTSDVTRLRQKNNNPRYASRPTSDIRGPTEELLIRE